jgi:hypothetical protein
MRRLPGGACGRVMEERVTAARGRICWVVVMALNGAVVVVVVVVVMFVEEEATGGSSICPS